MFQMKSFLIHNPPGTCLVGNLQRDQNIVQMFSQVTPNGVCKLICSISASGNLVFKSVSIDMNLLFFLSADMFYLWYFSL